VLIIGTFVEFWSAPPTSDLIVAAEPGSSHFPSCSECILFMDAPPFVTTPNRNPSAHRPFIFSGSFSVAGSFCSFWPCFPGFLKPINSQSLRLFHRLFVVLDHRNFNLTPHLFLRSCSSLPGHSRPGDNSRFFFSHYFHIDRFLLSISLSVRTMAHLSRRLPFDFSSRRITPPSTDWL